VELGGELIATVERKSLADLSSTLSGGRLGYLMAALSAVGRAAVVVEDRYSSVFKQTWVRPAVFAGGLAEAQVRFPTVPIVFAETRQLAQEWTYRFLGAALAEAELDAAARDRFDSLLAPSVGSGPRHEPLTVDTRIVRQWARERGHAVSDRGRLPAAIVDAWRTEASGPVQD
jgi:hypothetical protein